MKKEEIYVIEDFVEDMEKKVSILSANLNILELDESQAKIAREAMKVLTKKLNKIKKAKDKKDLKKVLRVNKLVGDKSK